MDEDFVSVVVCTRGRNDSLGLTVRSVLACDYPSFELIVVDQNDDDSATEILSAYLSDPKLRHIHTKTVGKCLALNIGLSESKASIVALTDDDCEVPPNWLTVMAKSLRDHPSAAVVYCNVTAAEHDPAAGFIPEYVRHGDQLVHTVWGKREARGIGAGMAFLRQAILDLGGFDTFLGPGGPFYSADDWDITARALLNGYDVYETDRVAVRHYGYRSHRDGGDFSRRTWFSIGAAYSKPIKCGHWTFLSIVLYDLLFITLGPMIVGTIRLRRPYAVSRLIGFLQGFSKGLRTPVNKRLMLFQKNGG